MYAIIETGGKQYRVTPGESIEVESIGANVGETLEMGRVLLLAQDGQVVVGNPLVPGAKVRATVTQQGKGRRVAVFKFVGGNRYQRKRGHRQNRCRLLIGDIIRGEVGEQRPGRPKRAEKPQPVSKKEAVAPVAQVRIEALDLPPRVLAALEGAGLKTAEEVVKLTDEDLLAIRGFGAKSLEQVRAALEDKGLI